MMLANCWEMCLLKGAGESGGQTASACITDHEGCAPKMSGCNMHAENNLSWRAGHTANHFWPSDLDGWPNPKMLSNG